MKNFFFLLLFFSFLATSCNQEKKPVETVVDTQTNSVIVPEKFPIDSIVVDDSLKVDEILTLAFRSKVLILPAIKDSVLLDSIYAPEQLAGKEYSKSELLKNLKLKKEEYYKENKETVKDWKPSFAQTWHINSDMKVFSNENDFLTIQYTGDGYTGGAHGFYYENYKVFDLISKKTLQLSDMISDRDSKIWNRILMDNFLTADIDKGQAEMLLVKEIPLNNNFYFDKENLYFLYNQYEITAYAAGPVLIKVPFSVIKPLLKSEFKTRLDL